ncbi:hypothetical protein EKO27_g8895 [Xylaria grammica]|uniref:Uncharacterized protein n=1 Tax=Xylaria grammica TaxID=363999 RepID=A0A439CVN6_9PEZI|nr:hypothetical protein EKO27_g8895 [Xylaria grammica]
MANDTLTPTEWIDYVLYDEEGQICIDTSEERSPNDHNICRIIASLPDARLVDYLDEEKRNSLPPLDLSKIVVYHDEADGICVCIPILYQDDNGAGNVLNELRDLTKAFQKRGIDLEKLPPVEQFVLLCRSALRLPPFDNSVALWDRHSRELLAGLFHETGPENIKAPERTWTQALSRFFVKKRD